MSIQSQHHPDCASLDKCPEGIVKPCDCECEAARSSPYWPLFNHMANAHDLNLLESELEDICRVVEEMRPRVPDGLSGNMVVMAALEAMAGSSSSTERARFTDRLLTRLQAEEKRKAK